MAKAKAQTQPAKADKPKTEVETPKSPFPDKIPPRPREGPPPVFAPESEWLSLLKTDTQFKESLVKAFRKRHHLDDDSEITATTVLHPSDEYATLVVEIAPTKDVNDYRTVLFRGDTPAYQISSDRKEGDADITVFYTMAPYELVMPDGRYASISSHAVVRIPPPPYKKCKLPTLEKCLESVESVNRRLKEGVGDVMVKINL